MLKKSRVALCRLLEGVLILAVLVMVVDVLWGAITRWCGTFVAWLSSEHAVEAWAFLPRGQNEYTEEIAGEALPGPGSGSGTVRKGVRLKKRKKG